MELQPSHKTLKPIKKYTLRKGLLLILKCYNLRNLSNTIFNIVLSATNLVMIIIKDDQVKMKLS
jgi:hypothetical protein